MGGQDSGEDDPGAGEIFQLHETRAGGRGGADYTVEFSAADAGVEVGAGAGDGVYGDLEACGANAAERAARGRIDIGGGVPRGRGEHFAGIWTDGGRSDRSTHGCGQGGVHGIDGSGPLDHESGGGNELEAGDAGAWRE